MTNYPERGYFNNSIGFLDMNSIRPKAFCLMRNGDRILVYRSYDSVKNEYFWRPLGGSIEFGEHSRDAAAREMLEETGIEIEAAELLGVFENIFEYDGRPAHEIIFVYDAKFQDPTLYKRVELACYEHGNDRHFTANWKTIEEIASLREPLYPTGLGEFVSQLA